MSRPTGTARIKGRAAIEWQAEHGGVLMCYADPTDDYAGAVTAEQAAERVAVDPSLVYLDVPEDSLCPVCLNAGVHTPHDGGEDVAWDCGNTEPVVGPFCAECRAGRAAVDELGLDYFDRDLADDR